MFLGKETELKNIKILTLILIIFAATTMLVGCGKEDETKSKDSVDDLFSDIKKFNNQDEEALVQNILKEMLNKNVSADQIIYELNFPLKVDDNFIKWKISDESLIQKTGKLTYNNEKDEEVIIKATVGGKRELFYKLTILSKDKYDEAVFEIAAQSLLNNVDNIKGHIPLVEKTGPNNEILVTWESSNEKVITDKPINADVIIPAGFVTRSDKDEKVTLTAKLTWKGMEKTKEFKTTVIKKPETKDYDSYIYLYFRGNIYGNGESQNIHMSVSKDGFYWDALNKNELILKSTQGTLGVRDPYLIRSYEGDRFYLLATDLDANGGDWGAYSRNGSKSIVIWESDDLVNWSKERLIEIAPKNAGCMWAPEATYDKTTGEYIVYWASDIIGGNGKKIFYAKTRDFYTFSEPKVYKDVEKGTTFIDTSMIEYKGTYYRFTKNENEITLLLEVGNSVLGEFELIKTKIAGEEGVEGPAIYQINGQEKWCLYMDGYAYGNAGVGYFPLIAESLEDLKMANFRKLEPSEYKMPEGAKHGSFVPITKEEYQALVDKWGIN